MFAWGVSAYLVLTSPLALHRLNPIPQTWGFLLQTKTVTAINQTQGFKTSLNKHLDDLTDSGCVRFIVSRNLLRRFFMAQKHGNITNREHLWTHVHTYTLAYIFPTWDDVLSYFNRTHLDHRGMTSWEETSERLWELIVQMLPFSSTPRHSHPFGFPAGFFLLVFWV